MSTDQNLKKIKRVEIVEKYKKLGYVYCVHTLRMNSSSIKFYKTYSAAKRCKNRNLENPKNLLVSIFILDNFKLIF